MSSHNLYAKLLLILVVIPSILIAQRDRDKYIEDSDFGIDLSYKYQSDSLSRMTVDIVNISTEPVLISLSKNPNINSSDLAVVTTSYSHISDPLLLPKLGIPMKILYPNQRVVFTEDVHHSIVRRVLISFDFMTLSDYPYKRLRKRSRRGYWFTRIETIASEGLVFIDLSDYFELYAEKGTIQAVVHEVIFD